jgi:hypothetical protein
MSYAVDGLMSVICGKGGASISLKLRRWNPPSAFRVVGALRRPAESARLQMELDIGLRQ